MSRVGLAVMRMQPMHNGHSELLSWMTRECEDVYVGLGSCDKSATRSNPLNFDVRKAAIQNVFGTRIKVFPLADLGATTGTNDWADYVLDKVHKIGLKDPTDYYAGSKADAMWYKDRFFNEEISSKPMPRMHSSYPASVAYFWYREQPWDRLKGDFCEVDRRLHILDRNLNNCPPATELRSYIELGSDEWKQWVPRVNHQLIETNYPDKFKVGVS